MAEGLAASRGATPDYASAFAADVAGADARSAEDWARTILEDAPRALRWFVVAGWRCVLLLRLAPRGTAGTVAGWTLIASSTPTTVTLEVASRLITAHKVMSVAPDRITLTTYVWFRSRLGRAVWSALAPVHHRVEPLLVTLAASGTPGRA